ncbi:hypothetical protein WA026_015651 [Henosepilachna vigintioctopunctata]|uniref:Protein kinase domain-containing protein n=1 Tax=Henosepilachna vigintioctopunctata TaxID=420089 RepID=A0AAW1V936_9CUCU
MFHGRNDRHSLVNPLDDDISQEGSSSYYKCIQPRRGTLMKNTERIVRHITIKDTPDLEQVFILGNEIGEGSFGKVIVVTEKSTNTKWAMKMISKSLLVYLQREIQILKMVNHPHIVYLDKVYESSKKIYLILELCHGELWVLFKERKPFSETISKRITNDLASAVAYLHKNVHRDIKLENILLARNPKDPKDEYYIKLSDFGLSVIKTGTGIESMLHDCCGTILYMAPEMLSGSYSHQCDVWAIGVIMYLLLFGVYPFFSTHEKELARKILKDEVNYPASKVSADALNLMKQLLKKDPAYRITSSEMLESKWLAGGKAGINMMDMMKEWKDEIRVRYSNLFLLLVI